MATAILHSCSSSMQRGKYSMYIGLAFCIAIKRFVIESAVQWSRSRGIYIYSLGSGIGIIFMQRKWRDHFGRLSKVIRLLLHVRDPLLLLIFLLSFYFFFSRPSSFFPCPVSHDRMRRRRGRGMLRALFLSLDECNLCFALAMGHIGDSIKNGCSNREKMGRAHWLFRSHTHTLSLSLETLDLFRSSALSVGDPSVIFFCYNILS